MNLQIRDPRAHELAKKLAMKRNITITEAVIIALDAELEKERAKTDLVDYVAQLADELRKKGRPGGRDMTKDEIDAMWGHE